MSVMLNRVSRGISLAAMALAAHAQAAVAPSQVRVAVSPPASDPVWKTPGFKIEKAVECKVIAAASRTPGAPAAAEVISTGSAKAPVFNPGMPNPNGTYGTTPDDGFNTIFVPLDLAVDPNSHVGCSGRILANGQSVTAASRSGLVTRTITQLGGTGPMTVSPSLDQQALATVPPAIVRQGPLSLTYVYPKSGAGYQSAYFDFDTGTKSSSQSGADFKIVPGGMGFSYASGPVTATKIGAMPGTQVETGGTGFKLAPMNPAVCAKAVFGSMSEILHTDSRYMCIKTSGGRMAALFMQPGSTAYNQGTAANSTMLTVTYNFDYVVWQ